MVLTTPNCMVVRKKLNSNQYVVQDVNSLVLNLGSNSNARFGTIDAFVISKEDYEKITSETDKNALVAKINAGSPLIVISKEHLDLVSPKIRYVSENSLLDELMDLQVSTVEYNPGITPAETITISNDNINRQDDSNIDTTKIEEKKIEYKQELEKKQEEKKEEKEKEANTITAKEREKVERVVSLNTVNLYDIIRIASLRDKSISRLRDSLEKLTIRLRTADAATVDKVVDNYLEIEDDFCAALYNQLKLIIEELMRLFNNDMSGKVDAMYERVRTEALKNTYGLSYVEMNNILDERQKIAKELEDTLMYIADNYSNVNEVITDFVSHLRKYSFSTSPGYPVDASDTISDKRFEIYQKLIDIKLNASTYEQELTDKIEHALALIKTSFDVQVKIDKLIENERVLKTLGSNIDVLINMGPSTTVLKLLILKNKLLSMFDVTLIDPNGSFEGIVEFDNNLTYTRMIPEEFDSTMNYIIISEDASLGDKILEKANNVYIPSHDKDSDLDFKDKAVEYLENTYSCKAAVVVTPSARKHESKNKMVEVEFIDMLCNNSIFEECKYDRRILKTISKMR